MNAPAAIRQPALMRQEDDGLLLAPSLERRRLQCYLAQMIVDLVLLLAGFTVVGYCYLGETGAQDAAVSGQLLLPLFLTIALYNGTYSIDSLLDFWRGVASALLALGVSAGTVILLAFMSKTGAEFSRFAFTASIIAAGILMTWSRFQMRSFVQWRLGRVVMNELVITDGGPVVDFPGAIKVCASQFGLSPDLADPNALHRIGLVLRNIDRVVVSCPPERRAAWAMMLKGANVDGEVLDEQVFQLGAQGARVIGNHGTLLVSAGPLALRSRVVKRLFDLVFASTAIIVLSPLLLLAALAVKLEDGGPVLFVQTRVGRGNRFFQMYKFRSMSMALADGDGAVSASRNDQRVTRVGAVIRRTSIDELPQLINVLLGDMSLVGPRPHALGSQAGDKLFWEVDLRYWHRHSLKPGLSGLAQVRGFRGATDTEGDLLDRLQSDLEYLEGWTIFRDVKIVFMTMGVLVHDRAY